MTTTVGLDLWPTKTELKWSGISMIVGHIFIMTAAILISTKFDVYNVNNINDVIEFHQFVSSDSSQFKVKLGVTLCWISLPLLLIQNFSFRRLLVNLHPEYNVLGYLFDRAYTIWITVIIVIIPGLALVSVLHDWDYDNVYYSGYYTQLQCVVLVLELVDCASVADAIIILGIFLMWIITICKAKNGDPTYEQLAKLTIPGARKPCCRTYALYCLPILFGIGIIAYLIVIFEFADSGIMSFDSPLKIILFIVFAWKMRLGVWLIWLSKRIEQIQAIREEKRSLVTKTNFELIETNTETIAVK
eukprot:376087_1